MSLLATFGSLADVKAIVRSPQPQVVRIGWLMVALFLTRGRYYCAWKVC